MTDTYYNRFSVETDSVLVSQVGYTKTGFKAAYIRSTVSPGEGDFFAEYSLNNNAGATVYSGKAAYLGEKWNSYWWCADFSDFKTAGEYTVVFHSDAEKLISDVFEIDERLLTEKSLQTVLFDQLDQRRNEDANEVKEILEITKEFKNWDGKALLGWRDSSTVALHEIHATVIALQALCDTYDRIFDRLSKENKAKLIDNIKFGCTYVLALQEITDDPLTNGRFKHDLYDTVYSAPKIRNLYDAMNGMYILARCWQVMKNFDPATAALYKEAADRTYAMFEKRPCYLDEEFVTETPHGREYMTNAARIRYNISDPDFIFSNSLRTRDRLMYMKACVEFYKGTGDEKYFTKAAELGRQIAARQVTDEDDAVDGCIGMFMEFDNSDAIMIDWLQDFGFNLACQQPTDLEPFTDLLRFAPQHPDAPLWERVIRTYADGYVKRSAKLSPLGIYPIVAARGDHGGVKFFSSISHGATGLYGLAARNIAILGHYLGDPELIALAQRNVQFVIGLNPGFPDGYIEKKWAPTSLIYGLGNRYFAGKVHELFRTKKLAIGSGFNGFSAAPQFSQHGYGELPDLPLGIYNEKNELQFNEDYLPIGMGYISGVLFTEL